MNIEIKSRWSGSILFSVETDTVKLALEAAVKQGAYLEGANLEGAYLKGAYLKGAYLEGAYLEGAYLKGAYLQPIRDDLFAVLSCAPKEVAALREALVNGKVNGSQYEGECACLVGTIANARNVKHTDLGLLKPNASRPSERFFLSINKGDTPETNQFAKIAVEWIDIWLAGVMELAKGRA